MVEGGNERIQCIEVNQISNKPILIICVYKKKYILDFTMDRKSFVISQGQDCSEIDYFLVDASFQYCSQKKTILDMPSNTSDHHPITISLKVFMENNKSIIHQKPKTTIRVKWDKLDTNKYRDNTRFKMTENNKLLMGGNTEKSVKVFTNILNESIAELIPARKIRKNKPKFKVWNEEIKRALQHIRMAHKEWREAGKPNEGELIKTKKSCKSKLRKSVKEWNRQLNQLK